MLFLYPNPYTLTPTFASHCLNTTSPRADGLVSTPDKPLNSIFGSTSGKCVINDQAARLGPFAFGTGNIYDNLKATFYGKAKTSATVNKHALISGDVTQTSISSLTTTDHLYNFSGNLTINGTISGDRTGIIFVDGNLIIGPITGNQLIYGSNSSGLVFVVKGNVNINSTITRVDTVIISTGTIDTGIASSQLVINGSLVSLNPALPIQFRRDLGSSNSTSAAEKINYQSKYLVILRDLFSQTDQRWSEVAGRVNVPAPAAGQAPGAPTGISATAGNQSASVSWVAPADPGTSPIIDYTVTSSPGSFTATSTSSPATVSGLTNSTAYTFTVKARNLVGLGPASAESNSVTPQVVLAQMISPAPGSTFASSTVTFSWTAGTGVSQYWLWVSNTTGTCDGSLYSQNQMTNLSATVTGVSTTEPVCVRLWSLISGSWQCIEYGYNPGQTFVSRTPARC